MSVTCGLWYLVWLSYCLSIFFLAPLSFTSTPCIEWMCFVRVLRSVLLFYYVVTPTFWDFFFMWNRNCKLVPTKSCWLQVLQYSEQVDYYHSSAHVSNQHVVSRSSGLEDCLFLIIVCRFSSFFLVAWRYKGITIPSEMEMTWNRAISFYFMAIQDKILDTCLPDPQIFLKYFWLKNSRSTNTREIDLFIRQESVYNKSKYFAPINVICHSHDSFKIQFSYSRHGIEQGWSNFVNNPATYDNFQKSGRRTETWVGWRRCLDKDFPLSAILYLIHL